MSSFASPLSACTHSGCRTSGTTEYSVLAVITVIQPSIGTLDFYAIRTFEKSTAPVLAAVMAVERRGVAVRSIGHEPKVQ